jgi:hypothetical protein
VREKREDKTIAAQLKKNWRKPLPVSVRINQRPSRPWRIKLMPTGDSSFYLDLQESVRCSHSRAYWPVWWRGITFRNRWGTVIPIRERGFWNEENRRRDTFRDTGHRHTGDTFLDWMERRNERGACNGRGHCYCGRGDAVGTS